MGTAFWLTVQVGRRLIPVPLLLLLPFGLLLDILGLIALTIYCWRKKPALLPALSAGFFITRLLVNLLLHGGRLKVNVRDGKSRVRVFGGWRWR